MDFILKSTLRLLELGDFSTFQAIRAYFGGLVSIAIDTLNMTNCSMAHILFYVVSCQQHLKSKMTSEIYRYIFHFGDIEARDPPNVVHGALFLSDFSNSIDLFCLKQVMEDEGSL